MTKQEFDRIVNESVAAGADKAEAEAYAVAGYKLPVDSKGKPIFDKPTAKKAAKKAAKK